MSLIVTIDLGDGRVENVKVTPNTDVRVLAKRFCEKYQLNEEAEAVLIQEIRRNTKKSQGDSQINSSLSTNVTAVEKSPDKNCVSPGKPANNGVKLYEKGLRYMKIIESKIEKFKQMKKDTEDRELTFTPKINDSKYESSVEILLKSGSQTEQKLEKMRGEKLNSEINNCTFSPKISKKSRILSARRRISTPDKSFSASFGSLETKSWNM